MIKAKTNEKGNVEVIFAGKKIDILKEIECLSNAMTNFLKEQIELENNK